MTYSGHESGYKAAQRNAAKAVPHAAAAFATPALAILSVQVDIAVR